MSSHEPPCQLPELPKTQKLPDGARNVHKRCELQEALDSCESLESMDHQELPEQDFGPESPFQDLHISSHEPLHAMPIQKEACLKCGQKAPYYCYDCVQLMPRLQGRVPQVRLPVPVLLWRHAKESVAKSTGLHAKVLAPQDVTLVAFDPVLQPTCFLTVFSPSYAPDLLSDTLVLFPTPDAVYIDDVPLASYSRLLVLEGTWPQAKTMALTLMNFHATRGLAQRRFPKDLQRQRDYLSTATFVSPPLMGRGTQDLPRLRFVKLREAEIKGHFWRYQPHGPHCLSTIEAIFHVFKQLDKHLCGSDYRQASEKLSKDLLEEPRGSLWNAAALDNLLYFYSFLYHRIQHTYIQAGRSFHSKHVPGYIRKGEQGPA